MSSSQKRKKARRTFGRRGRKRDAFRWLDENGVPENLVPWYVDRFGVSVEDAERELTEIGYEDDMTTQEYDRDGIPYEQEYDGYSNEFRIVRKDGEDGD